jgi:hypothetical protein
VGWVGQMNIAGNPTMASSLKVAIVSRVMWRARWTAHSSFCSRRIEIARTISALWTPPAPSCANIIPGDDGASRCSIISPRAPQSIFAQRKMRPSSVALPPASLRRETCRSN